MSEIDYDMECAKQFLEFMRDFTLRWYGERCPDYEPECACCKAWNLFDQYREHTEG
jgi:hypothetical protein